MNPDRLHLLLDRYFDQLLTPEEKREFEQVLLTSPEARETFWQMSRWNGAIRQWGEQEWGRRDAEAVTFPRIPEALRPRVVALPLEPGIAAGRPIRRRWISGMPGHLLPLAAAASLAIGFFVWMRSVTFQPGSGEQAVNIARIEHSGLAAWKDAGSALKEGEWLRRGDTIDLKSGALQVDFAKGCRVILQGPAQFEISSANSGIIHYGRLLATVPASAHGFVVRGPDFSVTDYGTQFGCIASLASPPEVHVFQGLVGVESGTNAEDKLHEDQAVRLAATGAQDIRPDAGAFLTEEKLAQLENARAAVEKWRQASRVFNQHPCMLIHFDFEGDDPDGVTRTLLNRAPNAPPQTNGTIEGCEWTEGRWPGKRALTFRDSADNMHLSIPGECTAMTYLAFVKIDGTPARENSVIRCSSDEEPGAVKWYVSDEGSLVWKIRAEPRGRANQMLRIASDPVLSGAGLNSWHMIATTFDGRTVTHYLDGKAIGGGPVGARDTEAIRFGDVVIGNGSQSAGEGSPLTEVSNFSGSIDELAILSTALSGAEIQKLYEDGQNGR